MRDAHMDLRSSSGRFRRHFDRENSDKSVYGLNPVSSDRGGMVQAVCRIGGNPGQVHGVGMVCVTTERYRPRVGRPVRDVPCRYER